MKENHPFFILKKEAVRWSLPRGRRGLCPQKKDERKSSFFHFKKRSGSMEFTTHDI